MQTFIASYFSNYKVEGIYANDIVMSLLRGNREAVKHITGMIYSICNIDFRLSAERRLQSAHDFNRFNLARTTPEITAGINYDDFYLDELSENCLDYFVSATK